MVIEILQLVVLLYISYISTKYLKHEEPGVQEDAGLSVDTPTPPVKEAKIWEYDVDEIKEQERREVAEAKMKEVMKNGKKE